MKFLSYVRVEVNRLFRARLTWLIMLMAAASPIFGFTVFKMNEVQTASTQMIVNPLMTGMIGSAVFFALFTLFELDRINKYGISALTDTIAPAIMLHVSKMSAVFTVSVTTWLLTVIAYMPYTIINMGYFFDLELYISAYLIFLLPSMWIGILFAAAFYQIFRRLDISFVLVTACVLLSFAGFTSENFILRWINPNIPVFSDGFGNAQPLRMGIYNRQFWLMFLGGAWLTSLLFTRKYEKSILGSLFSNIKKFYLPALGAVLIALSINHYMGQPFYNNAPPEIDWDAIRESNNLHAVSVTADVKPDYNKGTMYGVVTYKLRSGSGQTKMIINSGYDVYSIKADGETINHTDLSNDNYVVKHIQFDVPSGTRDLSIEYGGYPKLWGAFRNSMSGPEISHNNIELLNYSLIPSLNLFETTVTIHITLPDNFTLLCLQKNAVKGVDDNGNGTKTWVLRNSYDSSIGIFAANYTCTVINADTMSVEFYYHKNFKELLENNDAEEVLADVLNYCTERFGPLRSLDDGNLKLVQTAANNFGGSAMDGISNMGETTFSIYSLTDPWKGAAGKEILAHEIIHQWWGLNTMIWEDTAVSEWTSEGLTVYTTYRLYKEKYGEEYGLKNYVEQWKRAVEEMNRNFYRRNPEYLSIMPDNFAAHIRIRESKVIKYCLMPLKIYKAAELVGGEDVMDGILSKLSMADTYEMLSYQEFLDACGLMEEDLAID